MKSTWSSNVSVHQRGEHSRAHADGRTPYVCSQDATVHIWAAQRRLDGPPSLPTAFDREHLLKKQVFEGRPSKGQKKLVLHYVKKCLKISITIRNDNPPLKQATNSDKQKVSKKRSPKRSREGNKKKETGRTVTKDKEKKGNNVTTFRHFVRCYTGRAGHFHWVWCGEGKRMKTACPVPSS